MILSEKNRLGLETLLDELEMKFGVNLTLLSVTTLQNYDIEESSHYLYDLWNLGATTGDQSALVLLSVEEGRLHIYTGLGLRGVLSSRWQKLMVEQLAPIMESRDYQKALVAAVTMMTRRVYDESAKLPSRSTRLLEQKNQAFGIWQEFLHLLRGNEILAVVVIVVFGGVLVTTVAPHPHAPDEGDEEIKSGGFGRERTGAFGARKPTRYL